MCLPTHIITLRSHSLSTFLADGPPRHFLFLLLSTGTPKRETLISKGTMLQKHHSKYQTKATRRKQTRPHFVSGLSLCSHLSPPQSPGGGGGSRESDGQHADEKQAHFGQPQSPTARACCCAGRLLKKTNEHAHGCATYARPTPKPHNPACILARDCDAGLNLSLPSIPCVARGGRASAAFNFLPEKFINREVFFSQTFGGV